MLIKVIVVIFTAPLMLFRLFKRNSEVNIENHQDELDDSQIVEVVATWNLLNPP